jgi:FkbM family methyltransferase
MNPLKSFYHFLKYYLQKFIIFFRYPKLTFVKAPLSSSSHVRKGDLSFSYSQFSQDLIVDKLLNGMLNGVFVDIGSNHPLFNSNTAFFEYARSWSGICIDPLANFADLYTSLRPNTEFINCAVSDVNGHVPFTIVRGTEGWEDQLSSVSSRARGYQTEHLDVPCRRLDSILSGHGYDWNSIDFMSLDVEGHELPVVSSLGSYRPKILLVENINPFYGSMRLRKYIIAMGYRYVKRIWSTDDLFLLRVE